MKKYKVNVNGTVYEVAIEVMDGAAPAAPAPAAPAAAPAPAVKEEPAPEPAPVPAAEPPKPAVNDEDWDILERIFSKKK